MFSLRTKSINYQLDIEVFTVVPHFIQNITFFSKIVSMLFFKNIFLHTNSSRSVTTRIFDLNNSNQTSEQSNSKKVLKFISLHNYLFELFFETNVQYWIFFRFDLRYFLRIVKFFQQNICLFLTLRVVDKVIKKHKLLRYSSKF